MRAERISLELAVRLALPGFTLRVERPLALAGVTALFGPNGAGKSTLLRVVAGLEREAEGRVALGGSVWLDSRARRFVPPHRRGVGYVFQDARLFGHHSVAGNLRFAAKRSGTDAAFWGEVVAALDLASLLPRRPASLSGGERQRVALGRALLSRPRLLLLDEPLAALDRHRKADILPYLDRVTGNFGLPTLYVSHAIDEVAHLADRFAVMEAGRIVAEGPTADMLERLDLQPLTGRFEAGVMVEATVRAHDAAMHLTRLDLAGQPLTMPMLAHLQPKERVRLRVRARDVALAIRPPEGLSIRNVLAGKIETVSREQDTAFAEVLVAIAGPDGGERPRLRARITRAAAAELGLTPGKPVFALIKSVSFDRRGLSH